MKIIVVGLGNFGGSLSLYLMEKGAEVIGVDVRMNKVEALKDKLTYTICLDTTDEIALKQLPLKDTDIVVISIGEDIGASVTTTALIKKNTNAKIIGRAISPVHETIIQAMGIAHIIQPEASFAKELASSICLKGTIKTMLLDQQFEIAEVNLPDSFDGKSILETDLRKKYNINVITILRSDMLLGVQEHLKNSKSVLGVISPETVLRKDDVLVLFGKNNDIENFNKKYNV